MCSNLFLILALLQTPTPAADTLVVSTAGSMGPAFKALEAQFVAAHPNVVPVLISGGSVAAARNVMTAPPDVFVSADDTIIDALLVPKYAVWYAKFASNRLVLGYTPKSKFADEITTANWYDVMTRPGVHGTHSQPSEDPGGYRAVMLFALAEQYYHRPGLAAALERAAPAAALTSDKLNAMFAAGEVDYIPIYAASAAARGLKWVELPPEINLGDATRAAAYAVARVKISATVEIRGAPVVYGLTIPRAAPHAKLALAFARFALSSEAKPALVAAGFEVPTHPTIRGAAPW